jgi:hypothetical protein
MSLLERFSAPAASRVAAAAIAAVVVLHGFVSTMAPGVAGADAPAAEFSAERAMEHVRVIAAEPHSMGSPEIAAVRDYLVGETEALGMEVDQQVVIAPDVYGAPGRTVEVVNVIAWIPGADHTRFVLLMAHYDTVPSTPGANDNTSAVAALLETARALQAGPPLRNDVVFLFTDGEEPAPRYGSPAFAALPGLLDDLGVVVNLEANGGSGASTLAETSGPAAWLVGEWAKAAPNPVGSSVLTTISRAIGEVGTDFDVFDDAGLPGLHFAYLRGSPIYHTMADDVDALGLASMQHHGDNALAVARHFGDLDLAEVPGSGEAVFFPIRPLLVRYPVWLGMVVALLALALFGAVVWRSVRVGAATPSAVLRAAGAAAAGGLAGALAGTLVWMGWAAWRSTPGLYEMYLSLAVLLVIGVAVGRVVEQKAGRGETGERRLGRLAVWVVLAAVTGFLTPGVGYLFGWGALAASAAVLWRPSGPAAGIARFALVAAPVLLLMTPVIDYLFHFASPRPGNPGSELHFMVLLPLLLALAAAGLVAGRWHEADEPT